MVELSSLLERLEALRDSSPAATSLPWNVDASYFAGWVRADAEFVVALVEAAPRLLAIVRAGAALREAVELYFNGQPRAWSKTTEAMDRWDKECTRPDMRRELEALEALAFKPWVVSECGQTWVQKPEEVPADAGPFCEEAEIRIALKRAVTLLRQVVGTEAKEDK